MVARSLIVGRDPLARAGLVALLAREAAVSVVGDAGFDEVDDALRGARVDALAVDAGGSLDGVRELEGAPPAVVLVSSDALAAEALSAGARGVLPRNADGPQLAAALQAAAAGLAVFEAGLLSTLLRPRISSEPPGEALTPREQEVLQLLSLGLSNKAIAGRLDISEHTAKFHVNAILAKLGAGSRAEAIVRAARLGLVVL
jgi:DNA-binding NarL/FixJ family response regulator